MERWALGVKRNKSKDRGKLSYRCREVLEIYASGKKEVAGLVKLCRLLRRDLYAEMYYSTHDEIAFATLVIFLPSHLHVELSKFDPAAFKRWRKAGL